MSTALQGIPTGKAIEDPYQRRSRRPVTSLQQIDLEAAENEAEPPAQLLYIGKHHKKALECLTESERRDFDLMAQELQSLYEAAALTYTAKKNAPPTPEKHDEKEPREDTSQGTSRIDNQAIDGTDETRPETTEQDEEGANGESDGNTAEAQGVLTETDPEPEEEIDPEEQARMDAAFAAALQADSTTE